MTRRRLICSSALLSLVSLPAAADGTNAGVSIENTATVAYSVGGSAQPDVNSNTATFVVDMLVNLVVAEVGGAATTTAPGASDQVTTFTLTNTSNATLDFSLATTQVSTGVGTLFGGTDGADATNVRIFVDANANGVFNDGVDTATFVDQLAPDASATVFVVADIPSGLVDGVAIGLTLSATAADGDTGGVIGSTLTETVGGDTPGSVDIVFGDDAGSLDIAGDGIFSADDAYFLSAALLTITKLANIISDPVNGSTNPKAVPGAVIEYCIQVQNGGTASATNIEITDTLPSETTFVEASIKSGGTVTAGACNADGAAEDDDAVGADESDPSGGSFAAGVVTVLLPTISAGQTLTALFRTTID